MRYSLVLRYYVAIFSFVICGTTECKGQAWIPVSCSPSLNSTFSQWFSCESDGYRQASNGFNCELWAFVLFEWLNCLYWFLSVNVVRSWKRRRWSIWFLSLPAVAKFLVIFMPFYSNRCIIVYRFNYRRAMFKSLSVVCKNFLVVSTCPGWLNIKKCYLEQKLLLLTIGW